MTRAVIGWPDRRLRTVATPVAEITDDIRALWDEMVAVMEAMPGFGLAAVQLGEMLRLAVVDASSARSQVVRMANPEVLQASAKVNVHAEASPNLPGVEARIARPRAVSVKFMNSDGVVERREFVGLWATSVQHQIDHLNGRMYFDHLGRVKRDMLLKKAAKIGRRT